jgi:hypothetical protein
MKHLFTWICCFLITISFGQEKFLELTIAPKSEGKALKGFEIILEPSSEVPISVIIKKKKQSIYLSTNNIHTIWVVKKGYFTYPIEVLLNEVPNAVQRDFVVTYLAEIEMTSATSPQIPARTILAFDPRYGKMTEIKGAP